MGATTEAEGAADTTLVVTGAAELTTGVTLLTTTAFEEVTATTDGAELTDTLVTGAALETGLVRVQGQLVIVKRVAWRASHVSKWVEEMQCGCAEKNLRLTSVTV